MASFDESLVANAVVQLAEFGSAGWLYQPAAGPARPLTVIVMAQPPALTEKPRTEIKPQRLQTLNNATTGILRSEWTDRDTITGDAGDGSRTYRLARPIYWDAGMVTWEAS